MSSGSPTGARGRRSSSSSSGQAGLGSIRSSRWKTEWRDFVSRNRTPAFIESESLPRRIAMVNLTDRIEQVNEKLMESTTTRTIELFSQFRIKLLVLVALVLGIGRFWLERACGVF